MKLSIILLVFIILTGCKNNQPSRSPNHTNLNYLSYRDYEPNPDEVVVTAKLISYESGVAEAEVVNQLKVGFSAKVVFNPGDRIKLLSSERPNEETFICAFTVRETLGNKDQYLITRYLK